MKKIRLLTTALTSAAALAGSAMTANAADIPNSRINTITCKVIIGGQSLNGLNDLMEQLQNCFPGIVFPDIQGPNQSCPTAPELPAPETPAPEAPAPETPAPEVPAPETPAPETPAPESPTPETPAPESPAPEAPAPETPAPEAPAPESPAPEAPAPETPAPEAPAPESPTPETPAPESPAPETPAPEAPAPDSEASAYIAKVVELVNQERAREGLAPLTVDLNVQAAAQVRAQEIVTSFSHTRPNGSSFSTALKEQNVSYRSAGENIAWGQRSPEEVVTAWMNSSGHRANIMNAGFTAIGVGYYQHNGVNYWSQLFTS